MFAKTSYATSFPSNMDFGFLSRCFNKSTIGVACLSALIRFAWLYYCRPKNNYKVQFYDPIHRKFLSCNCRKYFKPECSLVDCPSYKTKEIVDCLENAKISIDICVFTISNIPISKAVIAAHKSGIPVRIIISNCVLKNSKEVKEFKRVGIEVKIQNDVNDCYMHHKFAIVDSTRLIEGSMNWTHQATYGNWENFFITDQPSLISDFSKGFEKMWKTF